MLHDILARTYREIDEHLTDHAGTYGPHAAMLRELQATLATSMMALAPASTRRVATGRVRPTRAAIHVWSDGGAFYWDDAEDHGGFDRNSPTGPFHDEARAIEDAAACFGIEATQFAEINRDPPDRYAPAEAAASDEIVVPIPDMDAWDKFVSGNLDALQEQYGSVGRALQHARDGGLTLGGGAAPIVRVHFTE